MIDYENDQGLGNNQSSLKRFALIVPRRFLTLAYFFDRLGDQLAVVPLPFGDFPAVCLLLLLGRNGLDGPTAPVNIDNSLVGSGRVPGCLMFLVRRVAGYGPDQGPYTGAQ
jgi:hypothetical protein